MQGRWLGAADMVGLKQWIQERPGWSRKRLATGLCEHWQWRDSRGRLKDFAARSLLLKLAGEGHIELPPLQEKKRRPPRAIPPLPQWELPSPIADALSEINPLQVQVVQAGTAEWKRWSFYLHRFHYLGFRMVGENMGYLIEDAQHRDVACLLFGAAAWKCAVRDRFLGWKNQGRHEQLTRIANNTRFLILPWVRVKFLASHVLGLVSRRIGRDWLEKYGHGLDWLETFVDAARFQGRCYAAANWVCVGETQGRGRQDRQHEGLAGRKKVFLYGMSA
jgi:Druantia protein DruA